MFGIPSSKIKSVNFKKRGFGLGFGYLTPKFSAAFKNKILLSLKSEFNKKFIEHYYKI